jgi:serine/threonine protein kinase
MKTASSSNYNTNQVLYESRDLLEKFAHQPIASLQSLHLDWSTNRFSLGTDLADLLFKNGLTDVHSRDLLNQSGRLFLSRILLNFQEQIKIGSIINDRYEITARIKIGKNSAIYHATHRVLGSSVVLKFVRPGASNNIASSLKLISLLNKRSRIVRPIDLFEMDVNDTFNNKIKIDCIVFPAVEGKTLKSFLEQKSYHLNSHVALSFISQVGETLADLEGLNAYHGDLHDENIIVQQDLDGRLDFSIIDVSYGSMGSLSISDCKNRDLSQFRQHVWRILSLQKSYLPNMSLRKFLGTKQFLEINKILSGQVNSFKDIVSIINNSNDFSLYLDQKAEFLTRAFNQPKTFRLQRYEEIIDPSAAARLFVPFPELMERVSGFSNAYVSGNRGSGKSTYLASLAYFASNETPKVDVAETFGVYFPCRQGEFKSLRQNETWTSVEAQERTTAVVLTKIIRRTLEEIAGGIARGKIKEPSNLRTLRDFLNKIIPKPGIVSVQKELLPEVQNFSSSMVRVEMEMICDFRSNKKFAAERIQVADLIDFFNTIRKTFFELSTTRFHILFDDAGAPNLSSIVQKVLCDLMLTSNPVFCVKFSAEKFTFSFESSFGKVPENGHDYFEHDISYMLFIGSKTARLASDGLERYFRAIVEQRLEFFGYKSHKIVDYLGDNIAISKQLIGLLSAGRKDARYAGWTAVWHIADRTPRNLLELVSEIFAFADVRPDTNPVSISLAIQDKAIRTVSEKRLQSLSQIAGQIYLSGKKVSLGRRLYEVTASIGAIFRSYLRQEAGKPVKRQHLAIERNDLDDLSAEAGELLRKLISFGVLDDSKADYARDDIIKKPIYVLNRIYCPAFNILYRRDDHLRLSRSKFELLLLNPEGFVRYGTKRLTALASDGKELGGLFGFNIYE